MRSTVITRARVLILLAGVALGATGLYGVGAVFGAPADKTVYACVRNDQGQSNVRIVEKGTSCLANETRRTWNVTGPTGATGPTGPTGADFQADLPATSTRLLFPFVTNQAGFDTGFSIANTTADPYGTPQTGGTCTLTFFGNVSGGGAVPPPTTTPTIAAGATYVNLTSTVAPGFQGYLFADCTFPLAHGFALVTDGPIGVADVGTSYLALVVSNPRHIGEALDN